MLPVETLVNLDFGPRKEPRGNRRPPNSNQEPILNPNQLGGGGQIFIKSRAHKGGNGQDVVK